MRRHRQAKERGKTVNRSGMAAYCRIAVWWSSAVHASFARETALCSAKRVLISFFFMVFADTVLRTLAVESIPGKPTSSDFS